MLLLVFMVFMVFMLPVLLLLLLLLLVGVGVLLLLMMAYLLVPVLRVSRLSLFCILLPMWVTADSSNLPSNNELLCCFQLSAVLIFNKFWLLT